MKFELLPLPYEADALEPFISARTVKIHHEKHHGGYVAKLDKALDDSSLREKKLHEIMLETSDDTFNLAAQVWNHDFYWQSLSPVTQELDTETRLAGLIAEGFGNMDQFFESFKSVAANEFGSGWAWLAYSPADERVELFSTTDAVNPLTTGRIPLLTLDVWEHAYYLDYQNERGRYIDTFLNGHLNWSFAQDNLQKVLGSDG